MKLWSWIFNIIFQTAISYW